MDTAESRAAHDAQVALVEIVAAFVGDGSGWFVFTAPHRPVGVHRVGVYRVESDDWRSLIPTARAAMGVD